jgi:Spy/CpxP family protein refolding chaperone
MNRMHMQMLAFGLAASLGLAATAQTPPPPAAGADPSPALRHQGSHGGHGGQGRMDPAKAQERSARMQERMAQRAAALKQKLLITPAQEPAWTSFTSAMRPAARPQRPDRAAIERMTTPERIDQMRTLRTQRMAQMDRRADATKAFYATLSPEQKKVFDAETARRGGHHGGRGHHQHQRG